jgi:DNA invertase Pin-like site-specific DNA recombinase
MRTVAVIPQTIKRKSLIRTAAYARVSREKEMSIVSLSAQVDYYTKYIQSNPEWTMAGIYIDEAITGTKDSRENFTRLLEDCEAGKIDLIITKTVSRFARNTLDLLSACRRLSELGIDVFFEAQNLHSNSSEGELMLTLLASLAQDEARSDSENMRWRIQKNFEEGKPWNVVVYGYRAVDGVFQIVPEEAKVVRRIFQYYLAGWGPNRIVKQLNKEKIPTRLNCEWVENTVRGMLKNPMYVGTLILQQTFCQNYLTKKRVPNQGELPKYIVEEAHEPIIDKETFDTVGRMLAAKSTKKIYKKADKESPFAKRIICDHCGLHYRRRYSHGKIKWACTTFAQKGKAICPRSKEIPEPELERLSADVLALDDFDESAFLKRVDHIVACVDNRLVFHLADGTTAERIWKLRSRAESWTPQMKQKARERSMKNAENN